MFYYMKKQVKYLVVDEGYKWTYECDEIRSNAPTHFVTAYAAIFQNTSVDRKFARQSDTVPQLRKTLAIQDRKVESVTSLSIFNFRCQVDLTPKDLTLI